MDPIGSVHVAPTTERTAARSRFENAVESAKAQLARGALATADVAAPFLPGGPVLSAAVRGAIGPGEPLSVKSSSARKGAPAPPRDPGSGSTGSGSGSGTGGLSTGGDVLEATRALQIESQSMNLQYLQLQESMQAESREYTALSNVMKVKHDTAKAAINNIH
ncbi:hypothetical protein [Anaeromyxobacter paludicola]|uniref:Uncharacterized protein n=1 Tax=Anaeromyxobacter paludicola TaxID=2918171 RepID=A0ABM7XAR2_9BACT|nr:hypothetical protein [Anaeromyxobacter paludicola]BDG08940.1 hypothetical protein AMPC_20530 [Anaeromyxobacter paludicola]